MHKLSVSEVITDVVAFNYFCYFDPSQVLDIGLWENLLLKITDGKSRFKRAAHRLDGVA